MIEQETQELVTQVLSKLRTKAWYWLFRQQDLKLGISNAKRVVLAAARISGERELEVRAEPNLPGTFEGRDIAVILKWTDAGSLSISTTCGSCGRPHCGHSAALLSFLTEQTQAQTLFGFVERDEQAKKVEAAEEAGPRMVVDKLPAGTPLNQAGLATVRPASAQPMIEIRDAEMQPVLLLKRLTMRELAFGTSQFKVNARDIEVGVGIPMLRYEGCDNPFYLASSRLVSHFEFKREDGRRVRLYRDYYRERALLTEVRMMGLEFLNVVFPHMKPLEASPGCMTVPSEQQPLFWAHFREQMVPALEDAGWQVEVAEDFGYRIISPAEESWFTDLDEDEEGEGRRWFALNLGFMVDGQRISLVPVLSRALDQGLTPEVLEEASKENKAFMLALDLPGNPVVEITAQRLLPLIRLLTELMAILPRSEGRGALRGLTKGGGLRVDRLRAAQINEVGGLSVQIPESLKHLHERLQHFQTMQPVVMPPGLQAQLRPYQTDGVTWLQFLREFDLHGVLADDMGLGKTLQTITHLLVEKHNGRADRPSLVIAPTSVVRNWVREMKKFAPELKVLLLHGTERKSRFKSIKQHDVVVTTFQLMVRDEEVLKKQPWHVLALDEAQNIKNPKSQSAKSVKQLDARQRLCLTGTPMENHLGELWSLFDFLMPGFLGDPEAFRQLYRTPIEKRQDVGRQAQLAERLSPLMLRRTKDAVAKDLPPKTIMVRQIDLEGVQADLYETIRAAMDKRVREAIAAKGMDKSHIVVLDALLKLRQICCHPQLLKVEAAQGVKNSAKMDFLLNDMLPELLEEGRRILIFSQFTEMLGLIEHGLQKAGTPYVKLTGSTTDRETPVRQFQELQVPVFLISLKAGGAGLNLTAADTVIHYDPWWNPAVEAQASDRAHRIGQTKPVFVHKLICTGTIEEKIIELQQSKAAMLEGLLTGRIDQLKLTQEDIQKLLEPL
jgi:ERCC4-related helicase